MSERPTTGPPGNLMDAAAGRPRQEAFRLWLLLLFSAAMVVAISPFVVIRLANGQFQEAAINAAIVVTVGGLALRVWFTGTVSYAGTLLAIFYTSAALLVLYERGGPLLFWLYPVMLANIFILTRQAGIALNALALLAVLPLHGRYPTLDFLIFMASLLLVNLLAYIVASVTERRRLAVEQTEAVLRESELMRSRAEALAKMGSWWWDAASDTFHPSPEWRRVTGATAGRLSRERVLAHVYPPDLPEVRRRVDHSIETGEPYDIEHRIVRPDNGKLRWVKVYAEAVRNEGMSVRLYGFTQDITERKRTEEVLREKSYHLGERVKELNCINEVTEVLETWGNSLNQALRRIVEVIPPALQYPEVAAARIEIDGRVFVSAGFRETPWRLGKAIRAGGKPVGSVTLCYLEERPVSDEGPFLREERNLVDLIAHRLGHIIERQRIERELQRLVYEDRLTALPSRVGFAKQLESFLSIYGAASAPAHLVLLNLRKLNDVNQAHGYDIGDRLLAAVGRRLETALHHGECAGRLGSDQFGLLLRRAEAPAQAEQVARWLERLFSTPFRIRGRLINLDVTAGIVALDAGCRGSEEALRRAQLALHAAREEDDRRWLAFTPELDAQANDRIRVTEDLRTAIDERQFELHYQPKVDLADGRVVSAEALLRWRHPTHGLQAPGRFIPVAERSQLIVPIGEWVLRAACCGLRAWQQAGLPAVHVAVNVSMVQFARSDMAATVRRILDETGIEAGGLSVEITESLFEKQPAALLRQMGRLRAMGVRTALDDFGTGYSSLAHLHDYPFDEIKIDRRFVQSCADRAYSREIVRMVVRIAQTLGCDVVAEGVETAEQAALMRELGCRIAQGYYYSVPLPGPEFRHMLEQGRPLPLPVDRSGAATV